MRIPLQTRFNWILLAFLAAPLWGAPNDAPAPTPSNDMALLDQESKFEKEKTEYLQQNVLDKILGAGKGVVLVDVEMGLEAKTVIMGMDKNNSDKKKKGDDEEKGPAPAARVLVPGVPMPKSISQVEEDRGGSSQASGGSMTQKRLEVHTTIKKLMVTVLYDRKVSSDKLVAVKEAIVAILNVTESQMLFKPTAFTQTAWEELLLPKWIIPLFLALLLLLFLWGPLRSFFKRLNAALEDKRQLIEQTQKIEEEAEEQSEEDEEGDQEGAGGGEGEGEGEGLEELTPEELEAMKKFEPFTYVNEQNLKGLAYLLRKEEPWIVALVLSYLKPEFARPIFTSMPPELQARVAIETATIRQTSLEQVMSIDEYVKRKIDFVLGGVENLIKILNESDKNTRENILEYLRNEKPALYDRVREEVILFEDILNFPDTAIQGIVREVGTEQLSRALRGAPPDYLNRFFSNMSAGAAALLKESMDYGRPLAPEQIDEERKNLIDLIARLEKESKISVRKKRKMGILDGEEAADDTDGLNATLAKTADKKKEEPKEDPIKAQEFFQLGAGLFEQGRYADAIQQFHFAIQQQNTFWQGYQYLGATYAAQAMLPQAAGAYERMLELNPDPALAQWVAQWKMSVGLPAQVEAA